MSAQPASARYDVFLSYRRGHAPDARLLQRELQARGLRVFLDVDDLHAGDFGAQLLDVIRDTPKFVCVLTPGSLERCQDAEDWVRRELEAALDAGRDMVLVSFGVDLGGAAARLPPSLQGLPALNAIEFHHAYFDAFVDKLCGFLTAGQHNAREAASEELKELDERALSGGFQAWQLSVLREIYAPLGEQIAGLAGLSLFPTIAGQTYPVLSVHAQGSARSFRHRDIGPEQPRQRAVGELPEFGSGQALPAWIDAAPGADSRRRYYELLARTGRVRRWNMRGFALRQLELDAAHRLGGFDAALCTYGENCLTSHLLGYRMLRAYADGRDRQACREGRPQLQWRSRDDGGAVLGFDPEAGFHPLISVQALVLWREDSRDDDEAWHVASMERGGALAAAVGFWQFPPAGGFEIYGREDDDDDHVASQFDLRLAIVREFLEEIYGDPDMACEQPEDAGADHTGSPGYQAVMSALKRGSARIHLLGVVTELVGLRSEFSFAIVLDDPELLKLNYTVTLAEGATRQAKWLHGSREGRRLMRTPVDELGRFVRGKTWNPSSIAMLALLAELSRDRQSWFAQAYPDFPRIRLD